MLRLVTNTGTNTISKVVQQKAGDIGAKVTNQLQDQASMHNDNHETASAMLIQSTRALYQSYWGIVHQLTLCVAHGECAWYSFRFRGIANKTHCSKTRFRWVELLWACCGMILFMWQQVSFLCASVSFEQNSPKHFNLIPLSPSIQHWLLSEF